MNGRPVSTGSFVPQKSRHAVCKARVNGETTTSSARWISDKHLFASEAPRSSSRCVCFCNRDAKSRACCLPELATFAEVFYARRSMYVYRDAYGELHEISADDGVEQGDSLAPALFAYGLRGALAEAQKRIDA